ncbi:UDP-N-acetylglucosamine 2-epimerase (non-hydrolyzing) [Sporomusa sphaeroides]|uniref:non-hydrolyzing UDP-N-acetylglucosamine 2-epimerase n=1 Tax=Sporomusa sphaeroides TaxID=47679 RepID=UPI003DA17445
MKIVTVVGARPQFVKAAVVSRAASEENITEVIVHTGQHYDTNMSDVFFQEMQIPKPNYFLGIGGKSHGALTGQMLEKIEFVLMDEKPDVVLTYGDTDSTLAGALAAAKLHIPVAHVEAGLRSFNTAMPEEINRILTDRISRWLFCPTEAAVQNLLDEGYGNTCRNHHVYNVGDVMYDAALFYQKIAQPSRTVLDLLDKQSEFYLATVHRAENTDNPERLCAIFQALDEISSHKAVILPLHPRTRKVIAGMKLPLKNIEVIDPVGYFDMLTLLTHCNAVFTDSGGVQKEAYFFKKLCITLRDETEWVELVEYGYNALVGADKVKILDAQAGLASKRFDFSTELYGDGTAGEKIIQRLVVGLR